MRFCALFNAFAVSGSLSADRSSKMLQNEVLHAKKIDDTAENEAFEVPKMRY